MLDYEITAGINQSIASAIDSIKLLQKIHENKIRAEITEHKKLLQNERDAIIAEIRDSVKMQMDRAVAKLEAKFKAYEQTVSASTGSGIFPQVPLLSNQQILELQGAHFSAEQVVHILGDVLQRIPNTEDIIVPPDYLRYLLAKTAGIVR